MISIHQVIDYLYTILGARGHYYDDNKKNKSRKNKKVEGVYVCMHRWFAIASPEKNAYAGMYTMSCKRAGWRDANEAQRREDT